jgi:hypothetical protein
MMRGQGNGALLLRGLLWDEHGLCICTLISSYGYYEIDEYDSSSLLFVRVLD